LSYSRFDVGRNCWTVERAGRVSFLVDGAAYFSAFREAAMQARHCILILGWDFDSRIRMCPEDQTPGIPDRLGEFLHHLLARQKQLHVYVLTWDFHMIYWREREWWLPSKLSAHRRLHFLRDGAHPVGASHHQKIVIVDDAVAFVGGMDFAACRWVTSLHEPNHPARRPSEGDTPCRPFHDVQIMVDGPPATALGELARDRWRAASGTSIPFTKSVPDEIWPPRVRADLTDVRVAIARTAPRFGSRRPVTEVEALFVDSLGAARRHVYIETQYLTSRTIANCLVERLRDPHGPEVVMILHPNSDGWLEQHTMDVLRSRVVKRLRAADRFGRLGLYYPRIPGLREGINVHSKVCIIDDELVRVGSANLSNRSMGFDTECDLAIEAEGRPAVRRGIADLRDALLGEHLGVSRETVRHEIERDGSLIGTVERLRGDGRSLNSFDDGVAPDMSDIVPDAEFVDPSRPYEAQIFPIERRKPALRHFVEASWGISTNGGSGVSRCGCSKPSSPVLPHCRPFLPPDRSSRWIESGSSRRPPSSRSEFTGHAWRPSHPTTCLSRPLWSGRTWKPHRHPAESYRPMCLIRNSERHGPSQTIIPGLSHDDPHTGCANHRGRFLSAVFPNLYRA